MDCRLQAPFLSGMEAMISPVQLSTLRAKPTSLLV
jgi:hypothetical protein